MLEPGADLLTSGVVEPALVIAGALPLGDDEKRAAGDRAEQAPAAETAALARALEDPQLRECGHQFVLLPRTDRQPQHGDDRHVRLRRAQASSDTAPARITPLITYCHCGVVPSRLKPLPIIWRKNAPSADLQIAPSPPNSDVPPRTIAVIASNSMPLFAFH